MSALFVGRVCEARENVGLERVIAFIRLLWGQLPEDMGIFMAPFFAYGCSNAKHNGIFA